MPASWTQPDLDAVNKAIASGVTEVRFQDRTIVYRSVKDLLEAKSVIEIELLRPALPIRQHRFSTSDGW